MIIIFLTLGFFFALAYALIDRSSSPHRLWAGFIIAIAFLIAALFSIHSDAEAKQRRVRTRSIAGGNVVAGSSAPAYADYVYTPYAGTWSDAFLGTDCAENDFDFVSTDGFDDTIPNCSTGDYWDCDQSTTGLTSAALGTLSSKGVLSKSLSAGWKSTISNRTALADNTDMHFRFLFKWATYSDEIFMLDPAGGNYVRVTITAASKTVAITFIDGGGSTYARTLANDVLTTSGWHLLDIHYDAVQGANSYPRFLVYINGDDVSPTEHTANHQGLGGSGQMNIMSTGTCPNSGSRGTTMLFAGFRQGYGITLADHQRDAAALGL